MIKRGRGRPSNIERIFNRSPDNSKKISFSQREEPKSPIKEKRKTRPTEAEESTIKKIVGRNSKRASSRSSQRERSKPLSQQKETRKIGASKEPSNMNSVFLPFSMLKVGSFCGHEGIFFPVAVIDTKTNTNLISYDQKQIVKNASKAQDNSKLTTAEQHEEEEAEIIYITYSGFDREDLKILRRKARLLGNSREVEVSMEKVTHMILNEAFTSKKLLFCLIFDVPILTKEYIDECTKQKKWIDYKEFEWKTFPHSGSRPNYEAIFKNLKVHVFSIYYGEEFNQYWLIYLLLECKCEIVDDEEEADIVISNRNYKGSLSKSLTTKVHFEWIFECILQGKLVDNTKFIFYDSL